MADRSLAIRRMLPAGTGRGRRIRNSIWGVLGSARGAPSPSSIMGAVKAKGCQPVKKSEKLLRFTLDDGTGTDRQILSGIAKWYKPEELVGKTLMAIVNLPPRKMMGQESQGMLISAVHTEKGEEALNLLILDDKIPAGAKMC